MDWPIEKSWMASPGANTLAYEVPLVKGAGETSVSLPPSGSETERLQVPTALPVLVARTLTSKGTPIWALVGAETSTVTGPTAALAGRGWTRDASATRSDASAARRDLVIALLDMSRFRALRWLGVSIGEIVRNTPILVQLLWVYYVLPIVFGVRIEALVALIIGLALYQAAFISEVYRSGIQSVPAEVGAV